MKALYNAILDKLVSDVPELKMIDFDLGQLVQEVLPPLNYPAALVRIDVNDLEDLGGRKQQGPASITITFIFRTFERTHSIAPEVHRAKGLEHLDILEKAKWALHGLAGDDFTQLSHRASTSADRVELRAYPMIFDTTLTLTPPPAQQQYIPWGEAGGAAPGPSLCIEDEDQQSLLS
jgi:hypothetical protein